MKKVVFILLLGVIFFSCNDEKDIPDVSNIKIDLQVERFEQDFFSIDTNNIDVSLDSLNAKYPTFLQDFLFNILSERAPVDTIKRDVKAFLSSYRFLYDSSQLIFKNIDKETATVKRGLQFVKYYFPKYKLPNKLVTFIGPLNSYSNVITTDALAVGLQTYMGKNYSLYNTEAGQQLYPAFVSRRFERQYMPVNSLKNIIDDISDNIYHNSIVGKPLIEQMVVAGKKLYMLDKFLPGVDDTLKTGYTKAQLDGAYTFESNIWSHFITSDLLYITDPNRIKDYMNDAPNTTALGTASPGFIGQFVGWQIVKKWMSKNENKTLDDLMKTPARQIFEEAKYKPVSD
jgi:hypothetical protein